jgi:hypothetical protein
MPKAGEEEVNQLARTVPDIVTVWGMAKSALTGEPFTLTDPRS